MANLPLKQMAEDIRAKSLEVLDLKEKQNTAGRTMTALKTDADQMVAFATVADGKKKYGNDTERRVASQATLDLNPEYVSAKEVYLATERPLEEGLIELDYRRLMFRATELDIRLDAKIRD